MTRHRYPYDDKSPRELCDKLGLSIDLSMEGNPAIVSKKGKRHYLSHGKTLQKSRHEMCQVLSRLICYLESSQ